MKSVALCFDIRKCRRGVGLINVVVIIVVDMLRRVLACVEANSAGDGSGIRAQRRPPSLPHPQSQARGQVHLHALRTGGRADQLTHHVSLVEYL